MTTSTTDGEIAELVHSLVGAYTAKELDQAVELFTDDAMVVGTGADELRFGRDEIRAQIERDMSQADALRATVDGIRIVSRGDAAWLFAHMTAEVTIGEESLVMEMRFTSAAVRTDVGWRLCQAHFSVPSAAQAEGESFGQPG